MHKPLTENIRAGDPPPDLATYQNLGGYQALRRALKDMTPSEVIEAVKDSNLRGRGGAGFPAGVKWSLVPSGDDAPRQRYLVCNADEMEPGTFKDRYLIEGNPHQLLEGVMLAAYAIKADTAYIFLRAEYTRSEKILRGAIDELLSERLLGEKILSSNYSLNIHLHTSAGRYICGEETALLNALEGKRAVPRAKPPFPPQVGLWGQPTIVQNVETLSNVPHIINNGADWFKGLSKTENSGTKIYGVSGRVKRPGLWELPLGTTLREIIEEHAGGMQDGYKFRGVIPGGASTDFLVEDHLDLPLDYETVAAAGSRLGTGTMIVLDDRTCPIAMVHNLESFFARESCGWCTPCRDGLPWVEKILSAIEEGRGVASDIDLLHQHSSMLGPGRTFCAFAPGAVEPLQSALKYFADDFEQHITEKRCPYEHH